jgi:hypothetical protein
VENGPCEAAVSLSEDLNIIVQYSGNAVRDPQN